MQEEKIKAQIIMVTGGQRSGKSVFAESLALKLSSHPIYLATARVMDEEMEHRIAIHKERRKGVWRNIESPLYADDVTISDNEVVLIDCLTLWAANWFFEKEECYNEAIASLKEQIEYLLKKNATFIIVTNEVGMGGISPNKMQRVFADLRELLINMWHRWLRKYI